jgi:DNA-directed DNA polymerase III PolC
MNAPIPLCHLHCHSYFSLLSGVIPIETLVDHAQKLGFTSLALTDRNGMYGTYQFYKHAKARGMKPILGVEITDPQDENRKIVVLAKNKTGYQDCCTITTNRHLDEEFDLIQEIRRLSRHVFVLTNHPDVLDVLTTHHLACQLMGEIILTPRYMSHSRAIYARCRRTCTPMVLTHDVYLLIPEDLLLHKIVRAIDENVNISQLEPSDLHCDGTQIFLSPEELYRQGGTVPEALENIQAVMDACQCELDFGTFVFPTYPYLEGCSEYEKLLDIAYKGLKERYFPISPEAFQRFAHEMEVIYQQGFAGYFLVVWDIVNQAREWEIPYVGRGSAANSIISYCLRITDVDPIRHNLPFERFMNIHRKSPPDIDLDFPWDDRDRILHYVYDRYGDAHTAMICETVTFRGRSAFREVAKAYGLSDMELSKISKRLPYYEPLTLEALQENYPECRSLPLQEEPYVSIMQLAQRLYRFPRHLSVHAGGIVLTNEPITHYSALEQVAKGLVVTQYDMYSTEEVGLVKIDLLGQRGLAVLRDCKKMIAQSGHRVPDVEDLDWVCKDERTRLLIRQGRTMGCFYIESPAMRALLKKLQADTFEMITAASSVIRPGVAESGMMQEYIRRHHLKDKSSIKYLHPRMKKVLEDTYGVMIYQEDVMHVLCNVARMSGADADWMRRAISGKSRGKTAIEQIEAHFFSACEEQGIEPATSQEIWRQISSFCGYSFCKAHSASFAVVSFKVAYLKAHFPAECMACVLTNQGGFYPTGAYIEEAKRLGLHILLPDINRSDWHYKGYKSKIRIGFQQIAEVSEKTLQRVIQKRSEGMYSSLSDFLFRTQIGVKESEILIEVGALDTLHIPRPRLLALLHLIHKDVRDAPFYDELTWKEGEQQTLERLRTLQDYTDVQRAHLEWKYLGFPVCCHPLDLFSDVITSHTKQLTYPRVVSSQLARWAGKRVTVVGWAITSKTVRIRPKPSSTDASQSASPRSSSQVNRLMKFLSLEDQVGLFEVTLFPSVYEACAHLLRSQGPYIVEGKVEHDHGVYTITAERVQLLEMFPKNLSMVQRM